MDVLRCERCGGRMSVVGFVTDPDLAAELLDHLQGLPPARHPGLNGGP